MNEIGFLELCPDEVRAAYEARKAEFWQGELAFRFIDPKEVGVIRGVLEEHAHAKAAAEQLLPLWGDGESNYVAIYAEGPLKGMICIIDHEYSFDASPVFRSYRSFCDSLKSGSASWWELAFDYPQAGTEMLKTASPEEVQKDLQAVNKLKASLEREPDPERLAIVPGFHAGELSSLLFDSDWHVVRRACLSMGFHKVHSALERMVQIAETEPKDLGYALDGIALLRSEAAIEAIHRLHPLHPRRTANFVRAYQLAGFETERDGDGWKCRRNAGEAWREV